MTRTASAFDDDWGDVLAELAQTIRDSSRGFRGLVDVSGLVDELRHAGRPLIEELQAASGGAA